MDLNYVSKVIRILFQTLEVGELLCQRPNVPLVSVVCRLINPSSTPPHPLVLSLPLSPSLSLSLARALSLSFAFSHRVATARGSGYGRTNALQRRRKAPQGAT